MTPNGDIRQLLGVVFAVLMSHIARRKAERNTYCVLEDTLPSPQEERFGCEIKVI